ncbi:MAG: hypothetical protein WC464_04115 [Bdellovibrionales bacterium]
MRQNVKFIGIFCAVLLIGFYAPIANAATLLGTACPNNVGETRMDNDNMHIVACVCATKPNCDTTGLKSDLIWKSMSKSNNLNISCPSGKVVRSISAGVATCEAPPTTVVTVTKEIPYTPPVPCPALAKYCVANVGCSGGCFGTFNVLLPSSAIGSSVPLSGSCRGPDYACGGHSCTFNITFSGTASCTSSSVWSCSISQTRTEYRDGQITGTSTSQLYSGACSGL